MLNLENIECVLGGEKILDIKKLNLSRPGLYVFLGPSGCGKTTLLNIIAGLNKQYTGSVTLFNKDYKAMKEAEICELRSSHLSIYFQHSVFLEELTLEDNILLTAINTNQELVNFNSEKVSLLARKLNIEHRLSQKVKKLSGGEKTRAALARTLAKEVPLYLFDEPTAALDSKNAHIAMKLIAEKAKRSIVILVSHDQQLIEEYADVILFLQYGEIVKVKEINNKKTKAVKTKEFQGDYGDNSDYIAKALLKAKKRQNLFTGTSINIGIVSLGLSLLLVSAINTKMTSAFQGSFTEDTRFVEADAIPPPSVVKSAKREDIVASFPGAYKVGAVYTNDMFTHFPSVNKLSLTFQNFDFPLPSFHVGLFNEPLFINEVKEETFPYISSLEMGEIALVLPFDDYKVLQNVLRLPFRNSPVDLGAYLKQNEVVLKLNVGNNLWDYFVEESFVLKSVLLGLEPYVIMGEPNDVVRLFEDKMGLPSSLNLTKEEEYPWTLKRINYLYSLNAEPLLWQTSKSEKYVVTLANRHYFRHIFSKSALLNRIVIFEAPPRFNEVLSVSNSSSFFTFDGGLTFIPQMMMVGYLYNFFLSPNPSLVDDVINLDKSEREKSRPNFELPAGIINLAIQYNGLGSFRFAKAQKEYALNEIGISSGLAEQLFNKTDVVGQSLHIGALTAISEINKEYQKEYQETSLVIKDVIDEDQSILYHQPLWSYLLFKDVFGVDVFSLRLNGVIVEEEIADTNLKVTYPFKEFKTSLDQSLSELQNYTLVIAVAAFALSTIIIFMVIYLLVSELNEEFSGLHLIGYAKKTLQKIINNYIKRFLGLNILLSLGQMFLFSFLIEYILSDTFLTPFKYHFEVLPYFVVVAFSLSLLFVLLTFFKGRVKKKDLLVFSKRDL